MFPILRGVAETYQTHQADDEEKPKSPRFLFGQQTTPARDLPKVLYLDVKCPILLQCTGWGWGPPQEPPPLIARLIEPQPIIRQVKPSGERQAKVSEIKNPTPLVGWPKVLYLSAEGPVLLVCTGWGRGPVGEEPPVLALKVDPQPPIATENESQPRT